MYRIWSVNQDIDISFMEDAQESIIAKWKARLEEEELLGSITTTGAISLNEDGVDVLLMC